MAPGQRRSLSRKHDVVLRLMRGEPVEGLSLRLGLPVYRLEAWRQRGLAGIDARQRNRSAAEALALAVSQPETNGVVECFIRTLKEQIISGRIHQDIEEVRTAVRAYVERYNQRGLLEKNGYRSPGETRRN